MQTFKQSILGLCAAATLSGCAAYKIDPPPGFVQASSSSYQTRLKAHDNVGVNVERHHNEKGGTLAYWAADMVTKLGRRGYVLTGQSAVESKNGRDGTRLDFDYTHPVTQKPKFYTVSLFVTDKYKIVVQVAGDAQHAAAYRARMAEILGEVKIRGCKLGSKVCGSPQPAKLQTPAPEVIPDGPPDLATDTPAPTNTPAPAAAPTNTPAPAVTPVAPSP